jgi:hypothetical protein
MKKPAMAMKALKKVRKKGSLKKDQEGSLKKDQKLNKGNLGELSLKDKILKAVEEHPPKPWCFRNPCQPAVDKSNAWNQHQVHLKKKGNESLKKEFGEMDKKGKGLSTALFLLKKNKSLFASVSKGVSQEVSLKKREKWLTQKEVDAKWTDQELEVHLASGRLIYREAGHNVWEYQDTQDIETVAGKRSLNTSLGRSMSWRKGMRQSGAKCWNRICTAFCWEALKKAKALPRALALRKAKAKVKPGPSPSPSPLRMLMRSLWTWQLP